MVTTLTVGANKIRGYFGWVGFTQPLGAGLGSMVGLNPQCIHSIRIGIFKANNSQRKLSTQYKQWFTGLTNSLFDSWLWMDLTMILPSKLVVVETVEQEYPGIYESLRLLNLT